MEGCVFFSDCCNYQNVNLYSICDHIRFTHGINVKYYRRKDEYKCVNCSGGQTRIFSSEQSICQHIEAKHAIHVEKITLRQILLEFDESEDDDESAHDTDHMIETYDIFDSIQIYNDTLRNSECIICNVDFKPTDIIVRCNKCNNGYCLNRGECKYKKHYVNNDACPMCREKFDAM